MRDAIIFVDMQNDFRQIMTNELIESVKKIVKYAYVLRIPVFWIKSYYFQILDYVPTADRLKGTHTGKRICIEGTDGSEIIDEFLPFLEHPNAKTVVKTWYSAFTETNLHCLLQELQITRLVYCGLTLNTCVRATYLDGVDRGYPSIIIKDCVASFNQKLLDRGLTFFEDKIINFYEYSNGFDIYCEGDTFILNNIFPSDIYNEEETFDQLVNSEGWKETKIRGGTLSRLVNVQANKIDNDFVPLYRNPGDNYIEAEPPNPILSKMMNHLNNTLNLDGFEVNHVFMKYYKSPTDGIGRHSDKTLDLLPHSYILNVSLGSTRNMIFRNKTSNNQKQIVKMMSNSCLVIGMKTNRKWLHEVKGDNRSDSLKTFDEKLHNGARMSFTFRSVGTYYCSTRNQFLGLGAPQLPFSDDKNDLIEAFSAENAESEFDRNSYYGNGFWALHT